MPLCRIGFIEDSADELFVVAVVGAAVGLRIVDVTVVPRVAAEKEIDEYGETADVHSERLGVILCCEG